MNTPVIRQGMIAQYYREKIEEWDIINSIYFYEWFPQYIIHEKVGNGHEWDKEVFNDIW